MQFSVEATPDLLRLMDEEVERGERSVTNAVRQESNTLKNRWRENIVSAGLGRRLAFTVQNVMFPTGTASLNAATMIFSKAPHIVAAHQEGSLIRAQNGAWLAIPLPAAGKLPGNRRMTPGDWEERNGMQLRFVYRRGGSALLVADDARLSKGKKRPRLARKHGGRRRKDGILTGATTALIFVLVPQVKLKKRLDLVRLTNQSVDRLSAAIEAGWTD
ncbi:hypothetical protein FHY55_19455 [Oceanicola sp. D3]|nr:hypothetical protein FHY55_19455 [Oceanicola sp. D3]